MINSRMYQEQDYNRVMEFLKEMYRFNKNQHCWLPQRWEYAHHLVNPLYIERGHPDCQQFIKIWEDDGKIVGLVHPEDTYNTFLQIRPGYRHLESEMISWAEDSISKTMEDTQDKKLVIWVNDSDSYRKHLLKNRGYKKGRECSYLNVQDLDNEFSPELPEGYSISSMVEDIELLHRYNVINKAFHPEDDYQDQVPESFLQMIEAPMYRRELDLVIQHRDGSLAASCTIWYDQQNKMAMFEPVGTHPEHRKKGLGKALLLSGLKRLKEMGAELAYVESYGESKYSFYSSVGFKAYDKAYPWEKLFNQQCK